MSHEESVRPRRIGFSEDADIIWRQEPQLIRQRVPPLHPFNSFLAAVGLAKTVRACLLSHSCLFVLIRGLTSPKPVP
jgi:hypothetical protein